MLNQDITFSENLDELLTRFSSENDCSLIIYCTEGKLQIEINEQQYLIRPHDMLLCQPDLIISNYMRSPDMKCGAVAVRKHALDDILYLCVREDTNWWEKSKYILQHPVIHLDERQQELLLLFHRLFQLYNEDPHSRLSENVRRVFVQAAVLELLNWLDGSVVQTQETERKQGRQEILFREFALLLQETQGRQREVRWFANRLAVTPKYLSVVCYNNTGKTAQVLINEVTTQEIKRLLRQTDMSTKEICGKMNFPSLSFFCKYVKQHLGMTAKQYRHS
ncbi:MAG: helix-turn-helix domain-containing protein [Paludibacteraceae bacterium]|nr:helix-turn-helix domain-containing protein [Paludibacteraceae bacterium]